MITCGCIRVLRSRQWAVGAAQWAAGSGQWAVGSHRGSGSFVGRFSRRRCVTLIGALVWLGTALITGAGASDWPVVRGDARASGASSLSLPEKLELLWEVTAEESGFEATAVIANGTVFVGDVDGTFYALDLSNGKQVWKRTFEDSGFISGAAVEGSQLVVTDFNGIIRCLDTASGDPRWEFEADSESHAAPNISGNLVLVVTEAGTLVAVDKTSGELKWRFRIDAPLRCWPTVVEGRVLLAGCDERLHAIDTASGEEVASREIDGPTGCTAARMGDFVFFGTEMGTLYSIGASDYQVQWRYNDPEHNSPIRASAAVGEQAVVFSNDGKMVYALNPSTGKPLWEFSARSAVKSSPVIVGERVYLATSRGRLHALALATGSETWLYEAGGRFLASPALASGRLVIGNNDGTLYCFGRKAEGKKAVNKIEE